MTWGNETENEAALIAQTFDRRLAKLSSLRPGARLKAMVALAKEGPWPARELPLTARALAWMADGDLARFHEMRELLASLGRDDAQARMSFSEAIALGSRRAALMTPGERSAASLATQASKAWRWS